MGVNSLQCARCDGICSACIPHGEGSWTRCLKAAYTPPPSLLVGEGGQGGEGSLAHHDAIS
jgi:hypothetical protein